MFIKVSDELSIETKNIEAVEEINELNCMVYTSRHSFKVKMPKKLVIQMISSGSQKDSESVTSLLKGIYSGQQSPRV